MKILIVGLVKNEQIERLKEEGKKREHVVDGAYTSELIIDTNNADFTPHLRGRDMSDYDLMYLWATGKRKWEWFTAALYLREKYGVKVVNEKVVSPEHNYYLTPAIDFMKQGKEGLPYPVSSLVFDTKGAEIAAKNYKFPVILKTSGGRKGTGVFRVFSLPEMNAKIKELKDTTTSFVIREFIPNDGDIRVFTVGYKAIGAMKRTPKEGDFRSNISQGGSGEEYNLNENVEVKKIAERASEITKTEIAGVDIIINRDTGKPYILEINPGPQFMGLEQYTSTNAALEIIKYFETVVE